MIVKLSDVAQITGGKRIPKGERLVARKTPYRYLRVADMKPGGVNTDSMMYIEKKEVADSLSRYRVSSGDLFISVAGTLGVVGIIPNELDGAFLTENADRIVCEDIDPLFLMYTLSSESCQSKLLRKTTTNAQPKLSLKAIRDLDIILPSQEEQRRIACILSTWEKAINTYDRLIALKKEHLTGLFLELTRNENALPLSEFCTVKKGKALSKKNTTPGDYPVIAGGKSSPYTHSEYNHENVITVSASGAYAGYVSFHPGKIWASDCSVVDCNNNFDTVYTFFALSSVQNSIYTLQSGGAQPHVYPKDLFDLKIPMPEKEKRVVLSKLFDSYNKGISSLERKRDLLKRQKQGLMQQLLA